MAPSDGRIATMAAVTGTTIRLPARVGRLVWFVDHWSPATVRPPGLVEVELPYGRYLYVLPLGRRAVGYEAYTFVRDAPPRRRVSRAAR